jgi:flagellar basal-body rod protein FlgC
MAEIGGIGPRPPHVRTLMSPLRISASGLAAQHQRMEAIATNIANAETTRTPDGGPYQRQVVSLAPALDGLGVRVAGVQRDTTQGQLVYDPGHPDADPSGYVRYPNVSVPTETVDLMVARRAYEANVTVFQVAKAMLRRALDI